MQRQEQIKHALQNNNVHMALHIFQKEKRGIYHAKLNELEHRIKYLWKSDVTTMIHLDTRNLPILSKKVLEICFLHLALYSSNQHIPSSDICPLRM